MEAVCSHEDGDDVMICAKSLEGEIFFFDLSVDQAVALHRQLIRAIVDAAFPTGGHNGD